MIENCSKEEMSLIKQRESRHPVTANSSRSATGSVKSRRSTTEKRSSVGDKPRSSHKEEKDNSNAKPIISVSVPKDEKKEEEKQIKDKVETGNKQRFVLYTISTTDSLSLHRKITPRIDYDNQLKKKLLFLISLLAMLSLNKYRLGFQTVYGQILCINMNKSLVINNDLAYTNLHAILMEIIC